jgi:hypothetical protein
VVWMQSTICWQSTPFDTPGIGLVAEVTPVRFWHERSAFGQLLLPPCDDCSHRRHPSTTHSLSCPLHWGPGQHWSPVVQVVIG